MRLISCLELGKLYNKNAEFDNAESSLLMIIDDLTNYIKSPNAPPSIANPNSTHPQKLKLMKLYWVIHTKN